MDFIVVLTTFESKEQAEELASLAVDRHLAACVQIVGPIESVYRWQGKVELANEFRCELKTASKLYPQLETLILDLHPYDVPEIVSFPIANVTSAYSNWLVEQLKQD